ncbi:NUDIX domain-containing protein [Labilibaculum antarcticum]|uniref:NUDIX hydrolase n=1 Tax=Labilibaculum antarcticum TaxID=1717717 RepID=A0A1Y1CF24_9BACT|nr:NUDIX hydrolase [Labilibaculum antarcticum]BAX78976.1 NUDIX hydrolase [Labilibaculum antarcticum]
MYTYQYPRPALTVDCAVFCKFNYKLYVLLIQRANPPFQNMWAFPGGFVDMDEDIEVAAYRELKEETRFVGFGLKQFKTYGGVNRDPRGRTVSVVYTGVMESEELPLVNGADDAKQAKWFAVDQLPPLAFDHDLIMSDLLKQLSFSNT